MSITSNAYTHIPGYAEHVQAEKLINDEISRTRAVKYAPTITAEDFVDAALAGAEFPANPREHNENIRSQRLNHGARIELLKNALKSLQARKRDNVTEHADEALTYLADELSKLMKQVRATQKVLGNVRTAEHVLDAEDPKVLAAWRERDELISRYNEIRSAQHSITSPGLGNGQSFKITAVGHIRNSLELSDFWLSKRRKSTSHRAATDPLAGVNAFDEWLGAGGDARFKYTSSAIPQEDHGGNKVNPWDYLVWLATTAEPWLPTIAQLQEAWTAADTAVAPAAYDSFKAQEKARDRYFEVIGIPPLVPYTNSPSGEKAGTRRVKRSSWGESAARSMGL